MRAMLVAAGLGTRLSPLTDLLPKPAVPVGNVPVAGHVMAHLHESGITEFVANAFHLPEALERALLSSLPPAANLALVRESRLLGTGGGIKNAIKPQPGEPVLVANAKVMFRPDLARLLAHHEARNAFATMVLKPMPQGARFGAIDVDGEGRVRAIRSPELAPGLRRCMFTGLHILSAQAHARLPEEGCLIEQGYMRWLQHGATIDAVVEDARFTDVGTSLAAYHGANMDLCRGVQRSPLVSPTGLQTLVAEGVTMARGASLHNCVVGAGAVLGPGHYERVVIWPDCTLEGSLSDSIVTPLGITPL